MKIRFDTNTPAPLAQFLRGHEVIRAGELGWQGLENGEFLDAAGQREFNVLITCDKNIPYQQNFKDRKLALVILPTNPSESGIGGPGVGSRESSRITANI